jgi:hypothetical protein
LNDFASIARAASSSLWIPRRVSESIASFIVVSFRIEQIVEAEFSHSPASADAYQGMARSVFRSWSGRRVLQSPEGVSVGLGWDESSVEGCRAVSRLASSRKTSTASCSRDLLRPDAWRILESPSGIHPHGFLGGRGWNKGASASCQPGTFSGPSTSHQEIPRQRGPRFGP